MATLGKLLLVVNLLAGGGLVYLATQDWAKRQDVAATAVKYNLVVSGLPVEGPAAPADVVPFQVETAGGHLVDTVSKAFLNSYFQGADGGPAVGGRQGVASQVEEVKAAQQKIDAAVSAADTDRAKLALLVGRYGRDASGRTTFEPGWLARLAVSFEERQLAVGMAAPADAKADGENVETARKMLTKKFETVLAAPNPKLAEQDSATLTAAAEKVRAAGDAVKQAYAKLTAAERANNAAALQAAREEYRVATEQLYAAEDEVRKVLLDRTPAASRDEGDRRVRIAHLLLHLDPSAAWQKRVALTTGLKAYHKAVTAQVGRLEKMAAATQRMIEIDDLKYRDEYEQLKGLSEQRSLLLKSQLSVRGNLDQQRVTDDELGKQRARQLADRVAALDKVKQDVAAALATQQAIEQELFAAQKAVGQTLDANFALEKKLDAAEQKAAGK